ncbi:MAG: transcription elongation factor GreA [Lachnospiraceae bacterium]|nr:transcription elongation factor GreA [Lachnospiraceae bacterium]
MKTEITKNKMTYDGVKALEEELDHLKVVSRKEIAQKIKEAREQGDLSENAEYDAALEEQREIEARIEEIDKILKNVVVIDPTDSAHDNSIGIGCVVTIYDEEFEEEVEYKIVGSKEAKIEENKISDESPVGKALIGKKEGDEVLVETNSGELKFKVLSIKR